MSLTTIDAMTPPQKREGPVNPNKALWEKGDFTQIAATMRESGEALANTLGITKDLLVLDLGCGDGTTAIPQAKLGAQVLGIDIAENLVEAGNAWVKAEGLSNCVFREGDATDLSELNDESFDLIVSIFHPSSPIHDGAVIIRNSRVSSAGCLLPISRDPAINKELGTRHRAALGLTHETDAVVIVVSEERGEMSLVHHGTMLRDLDINSLRQQLLELLGLRKYDARLHEKKEKEK